MYQHIHTFTLLVPSYTPSIPVLLYILIYIYIYIYIYIVSLDIITHVVTVIIIYNNLTYTGYKALITVMEYSLVIINKQLTYTHPIIIQPRTPWWTRRQLQANPFLCN